MATYMAGVLKVSNMIWVIFSRLALGLRGASVKQDGVLLRGHAELVVEGVVPDLLHVVPVGHDAVLNGVLEGEDTTLGLGLITDVRVLLAHADHHSRWRGRPTMEGNTARGASSPAKPALHMPEPLSTTRAATSSSHIVSESGLWLEGWLRVSGV